MGGDHSVPESLSRTKRCRKSGISPLLELGHPSFPALGHQCPGYQASKFELGLSLVASLVLRPLGLDMSYITGFPGSPAGRWPFILISLHNQANS